MRTLASCPPSFPNRLDDSLSRPGGRSAGVWPGLSQALKIDSRAQCPHRASMAGQKTADNRRPVIALLPKVEERVAVVAVDSEMFAR